MLPYGSPPLYLTFSSLVAVGLPHAVTTRHCPGITSPAAPPIPPRDTPEIRGAAPPIPPRDTAPPYSAAAGPVLAGAGLDLARGVWGRQVHGADVARVERPGAAGAVDVFVTTARGVALSVFSADCVPVTLYDAEAGVLALAHAGWRGTVRGVVQAAVGAAVDAGARVERLHAALGPSIGACCYEVDEPVIAAFRDAYGGAADAWMTPARPGHVMLDLWAAAESLLRAAGVPPARIENPRLCTACHLDLFYSYRKGHRGRLVSIAALP